MTTTNPTGQRQRRAAATALMLSVLGLSLIAGCKSPGGDTIGGPVTHNPSPAAGASQSALAPGSMGGYAPNDPGSTAGNATNDPSAAAG